MYVLNLWHAVPDFTAWKWVFDTDPLDREGSGVLRYTLTRNTDDEHLVTGHLLFDSLDEAEAFAGRLQELWNGPGRDVIEDPGLTITEVVEEKSFGREAGRRAA